jgi:MULE transposase domain
LKALEEYKYEVIHRTNAETGHLEFLLFLHPKILQFLSEHPEILHLDCTYSTNKYRLPLLDICGATGQNSTIHISVAILSGEKEVDFVEALTAINQILEKYDSLSTLSYFLTSSLPNYTRIKLIIYIGRA